MQTPLLRQPFGPSVLGVKNLAIKVVVPFRCANTATVAGTPIHTPEPLVTRVCPDWGGPLNDQDYAALEASWISRDIADQAMPRRVDGIEGREVACQKGKRDCSGLLIQIGRA